jgi:type II secretory pathway pseudopilin PulG
MVFLKTNPKGQVLLEVIAVVAAISLVVVGLVKGLATSLKNTRFSKEKSLAESYGREATEWLVYEKQDNWGAFEARSSNSGTTYCLSDLSSWPSTGACDPLVPGDFIAGTVYQREAVLTRVTPDEEVGIVVTVSWASGRVSAGAGETFVLTLNLTHWN